MTTARDDACPLVSIVTPSFNYGRFLGQCLSSVRGQTYPEIEHVLQDGGSADDSPEVVRRYQGTYRLRARFEPDGGQADALNRGFALAQGEILGWLNADDYLEPGAVARAVELLRARPEVDVVTAGGVFVDERGREIAPIPARDDAVRWLPYLDTILQPATFWRRRVHRALHAEFQFAFDWLLFLEQQQTGARFQVVDERWAAYRMHRVNKTALDPARRRWEVAEVLRRTRGSGSVQHRWARLVWRGFALSERIGWPGLKSATAVANTVVGKLTRHRVWSS